MKVLTNKNCVKKHTDRAAFRPSAATKNGKARLFYDYTSCTPVHVVHVRTTIGPKTLSFHIMVENDPTIQTLSQG